jgi:hypothetical protein
LEDKEVVLALHAKIQGEQTRDPKIEEELKTKQNNLS